MGRMKDLQIDADELERVGLNIPPFNSPPQESRNEKIAANFDDETWEHLVPGADNAFRDGCGPDFESTGDLFPDRPVELFREHLRYTDNGDVLRSRVARRYHD